LERKKLFLICLITGIFGGHYFAIGKFGRGLLYFFTVGGFFIGWFYDLYRIATVDDFKAEIDKIQEKNKQLLESQRQIAIQNRREDAQRTIEYKKQGIPYCPKCHSTSLTANKKGFGVGKAAAGVLIAGPYGLLAGGIGSKKVTVTCLNCGNQFKPGR
jgi:TM2 domain-containing membrane protein YozV